MTVVADTIILIDYLRARPAARNCVQRAVTAAEPILASTVTKIEILAGMRSDERGRTWRLFDVVQWIAVTEDIAERAGALARGYRTSHRHIELADYAIAATAQLHEAELWTVNVRHFPMFEGLSAPY